MKKKMSLKDLNFNNTGSWPREFKIGFGVLLGLFIFGLLWWWSIQDKRTELQGLERQESDLRAEFETKQGRAANLEPLKLQLVQMEQQLPFVSEQPEQMQQVYIQRHLF